MSSSWTRTSKASQRIHKERSQPESRKRLGFLEKKKDYKTRAADHERKQNTLKALRQKALDRNSDEFYFHMVNSKVKDGRHMEKAKEDAVTDTQKRLMKSQDLSYIRSKRVAEEKKIERLKASLAGTFLDKSRIKHVYYTDGEEEKKDLEKNLTSTDGPVEDEMSHDAADISPAAKKERKKLVKELEQRVARQQELRIIEQKLEVRKNLLEKRKPVKLKEATAEAPAVYKWTFQRRR